MPVTVLILVRVAVVADFDAVVGERHSDGLASHSVGGDGAFATETGEGGGGKEEGEGGDGSEEKFHSYFFAWLIVGWEVLAKESGLMMNEEILKLVLKMKCCVIVLYH